MIHDRSHHDEGNEPDRVSPIRNTGAPVLNAMLRIAFLKALLACAGLARTLRWIERRSQSPSPGGDTELRMVESAEYTVALAAALFPGRAQCLERSLALYWHLRSRGIAARYCMGVQMYPFLAHAWIEYRGQPVNDVPEHVGRFRAIEGLAP